MSHVLSVAIACAVSFVAGAFCPSILRKIKSFFVKETQAANKAVVNAAEDVAKKL